MSNNSQYQQQYQGQDLDQYQGQDLDQYQGQYQPIDGESPDIQDRIASGMLTGVNGVLGSEMASNIVEQSGQKTAEITKNLLTKFNNTLEDPELKKQLTEAIKNAGEYGSLIVDSGREPFAKAIDVVIANAPKMIAAAATGVVKAGTDVAAAVPFLGAVIELGKAANDGSKALSTVIESGSDMVEATSDFVNETKENFNEKLQDLEQQKQEGDMIADRTTNSINEFENPTPQNPMYGGRKKMTRKRPKKQRRKSRRKRRQ